MSVKQTRVSGATLTQAGGKASAETKKRLMISRSQNACVSVLGQIVCVHAAS